MIPTNIMQTLVNNTYQYNFVRFRDGDFLVKDLNLMCHFLDTFYVQIHTHTLLLLYRLRPNQKHTGSKPLFGVWKITHDVYNPIRAAIAVK